MADHSLGTDNAAHSWPEWAVSGEVRPQIASRLEGLAKRSKRRVRRWLWRSQGAPTTFDLGAIYRALPQRAGEPSLLKRMFRLAIDRESAIDSTLAALCFAVAGGNVARGEGLAAFLPLCYSEAELDQGIGRMRRQLQALGASLPQSLEEFLGWSDWETFAAGLQPVLKAMPAPSTAIERQRVPALPPRRVVIRISGGLGNQMFQYAAALGYARRVGLPLRLDLANYEGPYRERDFLLGRLAVPVRRASSFEVVWTRMRPHRQRGRGLDRYLFEDHGSAWLSGFWEDDAYFADIWPTVQRRFVPRNSQVAAAAAALVERARVAPGPVIGIHLRRGDRRPGGVSYAPLSSLPAVYFQEAAGRFPKDANFLVFSDTPEDIEWCRAYLGLGDGAQGTYGEGTDPILDMFALVACDHVILSSGTFSWWAGYLGERPGRRVIIPNVLQGLSAEWATSAVRTPHEGWEEVTVPVGASDPVVDM